MLHRWRSCEVHWQASDSGAWWSACGHLFCAAGTAISTRACLSIAHTGCAKKQSYQHQPSDEHGWAQATVLARVHRLYKDADAPRADTSSTANLLMRLHVGYCRDWTYPTHYPLLPLRRSRREIAACDAQSHSAAWRRLPSHSMLSAVFSDIVRQSVVFR